MRYTVHTHRTFHHRITKYLGVLVAAALVATLGLPSAVQAQTPPAPMVEGVGDGKVGGPDATVTATWVGVASTAIPMQSGWTVEYTEPGEPWADATAVYIKGEGMGALESPIPAADPRIHHGVWKFRVSYWNSTPDADPDDEATDKDGMVITGVRIGKPSALTDYLPRSAGRPDGPHGP